MQNSYQKHHFRRKKKILTKKSVMKCKKRRDLILMDDMNKNFKQYIKKVVRSHQCLKFFERFEGNILVQNLYFKTF